jgi:hypothetical protein
MVPVSQTHQQALPDKSLRLVFIEVRDALLRQSANASK